MLLSQFDYHEPKTITEACDVMAKFGKKAQCLAGGTDLLVHLKKKNVSLEHVICFLKISKLSNIKESSDHIIINPCVTVTELTESRIIENKLGALKKGAESLGSILVRNRETIVGNICNSSLAAVLLPSLIVYDATLTIESADGKREIPVKVFFKGLGTSLKENEILTEISIPIPPKCSGGEVYPVG